MITALLIAALAQTAAPEIRIDENGFVTVIETPEARARERQHIEMIAEAERAYREYESNRTGDALAVIEKFERILESGMELNPRVHHNIALRLAELHRKYATLPTQEAEELQQRIQERLMQRATEIDEEDMEAFHELIQRDDYRIHTRRAVTFKKEAIARLPQEERVEAARLWMETAMITETPRDRALHNLYARQKAREAIAADDSDKAEAEGIMELALFNAMGSLRRLGDASLCREIKEMFADDAELTTQLDEIIAESGKGK